MKQRRVLVHVTAKPDYQKKHFLKHEYHSGCLQLTRFAFLHLSRTTGRVALYQS